MTYEKGGRQMQGPQFEKFIETEQWLRADEEYSIPSSNPINFTHVGVRKGKTVLFHSSSDVSKYRSLSRWHFWKIPEGAKAFSFPDFRKTTGGYHCGEPIWCF